MKRLWSLLFLLLFVSVGCFEELEEISKEENIISKEKDTVSRVPWSNAQSEEKKLNKVDAGAKNGENHC